MPSDKAAQLHQRLQDRPYVPASNWRRVRSAIASDRAILAEIDRLERLANPVEKDEKLPF